MRPRTTLPSTPGESPRRPRRAPRTSARRARSTRIGLHAERLVTPILLVALAGAVTVGCSRSIQTPQGLTVTGKVAESLPDAVRDGLEQAPMLELLSLDPYPKSYYGAEEWARLGLEGLDSFHDYAVLGTTVLDDAARRRVVQALYDGVDESDGTVAACFNPRHGLRATGEGLAVDVVICFECLSFQAYADGAHAANATTTESPRATFDDALRQAGVRRPER